MWRLSVSALALVGLTALGAASLACLPAPTLMVPPDATRVGGLGSDGPHGAAWWQRTVRVRGDRAIDIDVIAAADDDADPLPAQHPVLFVHGGAAPAARYHWLARHLATRGHVVILPHFLFDLPFFADANVEDAFRAVATGDDIDVELAGVVGDEDAAIMGHSLGAVVAAGAFDRSDLFGSLVMVSGYPDPGSTPTRRDGFALSLVGDRDGLVDVAEVQSGLEALQTTSAGAVVSGLTHYQFTDDPSPSELAREGTEGDDLALVRRRTLFLLDAVVEDPRVVRDPSRWIDGLTPLSERP
jgi:pimeloyl-ACP methyl ester carboxylesterase